MTIDLEGGELRAIPPDEAASLEGGNIPLAGFLVGCFGAGFDFGYNVLGPRLFG